MWHCLVTEYKYRCCITKKKVLCRYARSRTLHDEFGLRAYPAVYSLTMDERVPELETLDECTACVAKSERRRRKEEKKAKAREQQQIKDEEKKERKENEENFGGLVNRVLNRFK